MNMPTPCKPKHKRITNLSENWKSKKFRFSSHEAPTLNANINTENEEFTNKDLLQVIKICSVTFEQTYGQLDQIPE